MAAGTPTRGKVVIPLGSCLSATCKVADADHADAELVKVECSNESCPWSGFMHRACYDEFEEEVLKFMRVTGRARSWSEKVRRSNLWSSKGYDLVKKYCKCRCGKGNLRRDTTWIIEERPRPLSDPGGGEGPAVGPTAGAAVHPSAGASALGPSDFGAPTDFGAPPRSPPTAAWSNGEDRWFGRGIGGGVGGGGPCEVDARPRPPGVIGMPPPASSVGSGSAVADGAASAWSTGAARPASDPDPWTQQPSAPPDIMGGLGMQRPGGGGLDLTLGAQVHGLGAQMGSRRGSGHGPHGHAVGPVVEPPGWTAPRPSGGAAAPQVSPWIYQGGGATDPHAHTAVPQGWASAGEPGLEQPASWGHEPAERRPSWGLGGHSSTSEPWPSAVVGGLGSGQGQQHPPQPTRQHQHPGGLQARGSTPTSPTSLAPPRPPGLTDPHPGGEAGLGLDADTWPLSLLRADESRREYTRS